MPLNVEKLKDLAAIMEFGNPGTMFEVSEDVASALRELIAIKEAEPVAYAWVGYLDGSYTEFPAIQEQEPNTVPLIRKPE